MRILSLNCQRGYTPGLEAFLRETLSSGEYDFMLLQEFAKEVPSFVEEAVGYSLLQASNPAGIPSQTVILYRSAYRLLKEKYLPFPKVRPDPVAGYKHATFGALLGRFATENGMFLLGSVHLHSGINPWVRAAQVGAVKESALILRTVGDRVIFGGDCNFGFWGERMRAERTLAPEFICATRRLGPTLNGRYSENVSNIPNRVAAFFGAFGIGLPLWTDQIFIDAEAASHHQVQARVLPDRVSDHSPVELMTEEGR